jgi:hypothetical protein
MPRLEPSEHSKHSRFEFDRSLQPLKVSGSDTNSDPFPLVSTMNGGEPKTCGKCCESGFGTPLEAMKGEREKLTLGNCLIRKSKILQTMFLHN